MKNECSVLLVGIYVGFFCELFWYNYLYNCLCCDNFPVVYVHHYIINYGQLSSLKITFDSSCNFLCISDIYFKFIIESIIIFCHGLDECIFEIGAQIFLTSLRQCRFSDPMIILPKTDQNEILNKTWHQSFVLMAAFWPTNLVTLFTG